MGGRVRAYKRGNPPPRLRASKCISCCKGPNGSLLLLWLELVLAALRLLGIYCAAARGLQLCFGCCRSIHAYAGGAPAGSGAVELKRCALCVADQLQGGWCLCQPDSRWLPCTSTPRHAVRATHKWLSRDAVVGCQTSGSDCFASLVRAHPRGPCAPGLPSFGKFAL